MLIAGAVIGVAVLAGAIGFALRTGSGLVTASATPGLAAVSASPSAPASGRASPDATNSQAAEDGMRAERIRIERLGIDLPIIEGDGIDAPLDKAAHYPGTAWPGGAKNNVYIYAHAQEGMFLTLWQVQIGDEVVLELEDDTERTYVVTQVLPEVPWDALEYLDPTSTEQLTLQTSTSYTPTSPKFVVIAVPSE